MMRHHVDLFLAPGQLTVQTRALKIKTIVGSCVAVCLWDPQARIGGINHYLLARPGPGDPHDTRFGTCAMEQLIARMKQAGADPRRLQAAVVGGGHPIDLEHADRIGAENVAIALAVLNANAIRIVRRETGGDHGRKLLFDTGTGELLVRRLRRGVGTFARELPR